MMARNDGHAFGYVLNDCSAFGRLLNLGTS